jgi:hypothetical protein
MLCLVSEVKNYLGITTIDSTEDALIETLIDGVSKLFEMYCGTVFEATEYTEFYDGDGTSCLFPYNYPITSISGIWDDMSWEWGDNTKIEATNYRIKNSNTIILRDIVFYDYEQNIKIIYTAGYITIPADIKQACVEETARKYKGKEHIDMVSLSFGTESTTKYINDLLPTTKTVLSKYRKISIC